MTHRRTPPSVSELVADLITCDSLRPEYAQELACFAPLLGSWDLDVTDFHPDGTSTRRQGEWHFTWALGGRALIDVWITPSRATQQEGEPGEWGMSVRFPSAESGVLRSTWLGPGRRVVFPFLARPDNDTITLSARLEEGCETRWRFTDITSASFNWRNEEVPDDGSDTRLLQTFRARRVEADDARRSPRADPMLRSGDLDTLEQLEVGRTMPASRGCSTNPMA